jgi:preprotein translocase subunit SecA
MNDQRKVVYAQRKEIMSAKDVQQTITDMRHETVENIVARTIPENALPDNWDVQGLHEECLRVFNLDLPVAEWAKEEGIADAEIQERLTSAIDRKMAEKSANYGPDVMRMAEKSILLQLLDQHWKDHLLQLDHLRQGINLRAYAQRDPLNEYKREAFELFEAMLATLRESVTAFLAHVELRVQRAEDAWPPAGTGGGGWQETRDDPALAEQRELAMANGDGWPAAPAAAMAGGGGDHGVDPRTPRNAPCPCGSGKKYKHCHGRI